MEQFSNAIFAASDWLWSGPMPLILLGTGLLFTVLLGFRPIWELPKAFATLISSGKGQGAGSISPLAALATALSGQIGTGNIAGVATAIALGGPGAIFWMWMTALVGMGTSFAEATLAVRYRRVAADGSTYGGPMYYIEDGLGKAWKPLAVLFALGAVYAAFSTGNMTQANSVANAMQGAIGLPVLWGGIILAGFTFVIIIGGIKSIGAVAEKIVPIMAGLYIVACLTILGLNIQDIPGALAFIVQDAFGPAQAAGGFIGAAMITGFRAGVARGIFSNEAGQGSTPIAHAAAKTDDPARQGRIATVGVFVDTLVVCTMTALVILTIHGDFKFNPARAELRICEARHGIDVPAAILDSAPSAYAQDRASVIANNGQNVLAQLEACAAAGAPVTNDGRRAAIEDFTMPADVAWQSDLAGVEVTNEAFKQGLHASAGIDALGSWVVTITLLLFAFTTIIGWSYYGESAVRYLFGERLGPKMVMPFRLAWVALVVVGAVLEVQFIWRFADVATAAMTFPNLIALLLLTPVVLRLVKENKDKKS